MLTLQAIRVYSVNPDLNHDQCMTLLANAGIYLVLDVNSPRPGEALNRYEPWSTYNAYYLEHIIRVVHQFSGYNNTLGFFAGNEVVNDEVSARESPQYIKAIIRDMHQYMQLHSPRQVPVGYSATDDLRYRIPLAKYLECGDPGTHVDFYGVNSYQWCGNQDFDTSGYRVLVDDYSDYSLPLFLSEYGCNVVRPRLFQEVEPLYSLNMTPVFSGGLIYEYAQEANNYGLVDIDGEGSANALPDFDSLKREYANVEIYYDFSKEKEQTRPLTCKLSYAHLRVGPKLPDSPIMSTIQRGLEMPMGRYVDLRINSTMFKIFDTRKNEVLDRRIRKVIDWKSPANGLHNYKEQEDLVRLPFKASENSAQTNGSTSYTALDPQQTMGEKMKDQVSNPAGARGGRGQHAKTSASSNTFFDSFSVKLLFWSFIVGGPLAGVVWFGLL